MSESKIIVMDLERYVSEMKRLGLFREKKNDYVVMCPKCREDHRLAGDSHYNHLHLWIDKSLLYGHCFRDGTVVLSDNQEINLKVDRLESPVDMSNWSLCKLGNEGFWTLDRFETFDKYDEEGVKYLCGRLSEYKDLYGKLGIRFNDHNPVVPFYYKGELIYYQIRIIDKKSKIKYYSPTIDHKPPYILEHGNNKKWVISEGTFDAMADRMLFPDRSAFSVLGSDITPYEIAMLRSYCPEDILIYMDETSISLRIKDTLEQFINYAEINIQYSNGEDPEEHLRGKLITEMFNFNK